ncbi:MAG: SDR family NAD(P)-dependent oxidoreductase [Solirubrobacteraceae bacterium MAG38_C4-C5]|nr:SDR family NAD(P)-dependent oxidoreductase [Candidatus Siliceabacter maunaloa]
MGFSANRRELPTAGLAHYSAAKAALSAYLAGLRHERRRTGINVIDVRPPHTATGFSDRPLAGSAPELPDPIDPAGLVDAVTSAMRDDRREVAWDLSARSLVVR